MPISVLTNNVAPSQSGFKFLTLDQMEAQPQESVSYVVEGLFPASGLSNLLGKPKWGKSSLARNLAASISTGEQFLGRDVVRGKVLYLALEEKANEVLKHFNELDADRSNILCHCEAAPVTDPLAQLETIASSTPDLKLVIIDPFLRFTRLDDVNSYGQATAAMERLMTFSRSHDAHVMLVHHLRKHESLDPSDGTLGSTAINGGVDTIMALQLKGQRRFLWTRQRYGKSMEPTFLSWDEETRRVSLGDSELDAPSNGRMSARLRIGCDIIGALAACGTLDQQGLARMVSGNDQIRQSVLEELVRANKVTRTGGGHRNDPYIYALTTIHTEGHI